jgi:hypothetical protein
LQVSAGSALSKHADRFGEASLPGLGLPGSLDPRRVPKLLAVGEPVEEAPGVRITVERFLEVAGDRYLARLGVEFDVDLDLIPGGDPGTQAVLSADADHELTAHGRHGAAVGVAVDRDAYRRLFAPTQARDDFRRNPDASRGLAGKQDRGMKSHAFSAVECVLGPIPNWPVASGSSVMSRAAIAEIHAHPSTTAMVKARFTKTASTKPTWAPS